MLHNRALNINKKAQNTALLFNVYKNKTYEFSDIICDLGLFAGWEIVENITAQFIVYKLVVDGFGGTKRTKRFETDILLRFQILNDDIFSDIETKFTSEPSSYNLKELSKRLPSLPIYNEDFIARVLDNPKKYEDLYFWAMKAQMELLIKQGYTQSYNTLLEWALEQFSSKEFSTLKAKAKSIFNWYHARGFKIFGAYERKYTDKELQMTRSENMTRINKLVKEKHQKTMLALLEQNEMLFESEFIHKDGRFKGLVNIQKLAKYMGVSEMTIRRNLKDMGIR
ncbi:MAG: hypothetical protein SPH02_04670 [Campylobacter sp.]|nr:hypothetical protein [Campylobacter sp.]